MSATQRHDGAWRDRSVKHDPAKAPMPGTTHDPNSVTTGTEVEPKGDVFPPPGTHEEDREEGAGSRA